MTARRSPLFVYVRLLPECDLPCAAGLGCPCPHSFPGAGGHPLPTERWRGILEGLARDGTRLLYFTDGNPLEHPDLWPLARHAAGLGLRVRVILPPERVTDEVAAEAAAAGLDAAQIRIGGARDETHDALRWPGAAAAAWAGAARLASAGVPVHVITPVLAPNAGELETLYRRVARIGLGELAVIRPVETGFRPGALAALLPSPEAYRDAVTVVLAAGAGGKGPVAKTADPLFVRQEPDVLERLGRLVAREPSSAGACLGGCLAGTDVLLLDYDGTVYPCRYLPWPTGSLAEGYDASRLFGGPLPRRWRGLLGGECGPCVVLPVCGGCRAQAWQEGSFFGSDSWCRGAFGGPVAGWPVAGPSGGVEP